MSYPTASRLRGMSLLDLIAALIAFRTAHGLPYGPATRTVRAGDPFAPIWAAP